MKANPIKQSLLQTHCAISHKSSSQNKIREKKRTTVVSIGKFMKMVVVVGCGYVEENKVYDQPIFGGLLLSHF
jgi:hypothetical protein